MTQVTTSPSKVVTILPPASRLEQLAEEINTGMGDIKSRTLTLCIKLAEAQKICGDEGVNFKDWMSDNLGLEHSVGYRYAKIGRSPDPVAALEVKRASYRATKGAVLHPTPATIVPDDDDEEDHDEEARRERGFLARAEDAKQFALDDNMDGVAVSGAMVEAARAAADAWYDLSVKLERGL